MLISTKHKAALLREACGARVDKAILEPLFIHAIGQCRPASENARCILQISIAISTAHGLLQLQACVFQIGTGRGPETFLQQQVFFGGDALQLLLDGIDAGLIACLFEPGKLEAHGGVGCA